MVTAFGEAAWRQLDARAIPFDAAMLQRLSPLLVIAPHPDDETLGCGGLLAACADRGLRPRVAVLTDGAASHRGSASWPPARLAAERKVEMLAALAILGLGESDTLFLGWPDGSPFERNSSEHAVSLTTLAEWAAESGVRAVFAPWEAENHCDHKAANEMARALVVRLGPDMARFDYLVWGWTDPALADAVADRRAFGFDCGPYRERLRGALACHRTQMTGLIADAADAFRVPADLAALTERDTEIFLETRAA